MVPPPLISPINSPKKTLKTDELHMMICAPDQAAAVQLLNKFTPATTYLGPHPRNSRNHFLFSTILPDHFIAEMKPIKFINHINEKCAMIKFRVISENQNYLPEKQNHCQDCMNRHVK